MGWTTCDSWELRGYFWGWGGESLGRRSEGREGRCWARVQFQGEGAATSAPPLKFRYLPLPLQALGCLLYACFIMGRLCVPVFANMSREPFSTRALVLSVMHATLPGMPTKAGLQEAVSWESLAGNPSLPLLFTFCQFQHLLLNLPSLLSPPITIHCQGLSSDEHLLPLSTSASQPVSLPPESFLSHLPLSSLLPR